MHGTRDASQLICLWSVRSDKCENREMSRSPTLYANDVSAVLSASPSLLT